MTEVARALAHARVLLDLKRYDESASLLVRVLAAEPEDGQAWCLLAAAHHGAGRYKETVAAASRAMSLQYSDDWPYRLASSAQRQLGNMSAAIAAANEACRLAPHQWRAHVCLAQAQLAARVDLYAAECSAVEALRLAPDEPDTHFIAGQVSYAREMWDRARAHLERALSLDPAHSGALNELGRIRLRRGDHRGAVRDFIRAAQVAPGVSAYARNVEVAIRRVIALTFWPAYLASAFLVLAMGSTSQRPVVIGYTLAIGFFTGYAVVQLWRMPVQVRPLFRTRRVLVRGTVYVVILIMMVTAVVTPMASVRMATVLVSIPLIVSVVIAGVFAGAAGSVAAAPGGPVAALTGGAGSPPAWISRGRRYYLISLICFVIMYLICVPGFVASQGSGLHHPWEWGIDLGISGTLLSVVLFEAARGRFRARSRIRQLAWALVPLVSTGFLAFVPFLWLALICRRVTEWAVFAAYLAAVTTGLALMGAYHAIPLGVDEIFTGLTVIATVHSVLAFSPAAGVPSWRHARRLPLDDTVR
jgi:tetratricopeptide (TPR) repeat protein